MTTGEYIFGIDGGGSGCRVSVCDRDGRVLAQAAGGPANFSTDRAATVQNVLDVIGQAKAQLQPDMVNATNSVAHIGLAGVMEKPDADTLAAAMPFTRLTVSDDRTTTVAGALGASDGIVVSVGTGSFVACQVGGSQRFLGGWGHVLGDQASGVWLGVQALRRAVLADEGLAAQSELTQVLMHDHGGTPLGLLSFVSAAQPAEFAALAPKVIEAGKSGDAHGLALMQEGAQYLMSCLQELRIADHSTLCLTGSIGPHYAAYFGADLTSRIQPPKGSALDGAVHLARRLL